MKFQSKLWNYTILDQFEIITEEFRPVWNLPRNTVDEKIKKSSWTMCHQQRGQIGGRDSLGDCDNICDGNLVFRVIFGKFMHRWFQICAQLGSFNEFFSHRRPPKLKYCFFRGSFARLTSQSQAGTLSNSRRLHRRHQCTSFRFFIEKLTLKVEIPLFWGFVPPSDFPKSGGDPV